MHSSITRDHVNKETFRTWQTEGVIVYYGASPGAPKTSSLQVYGCIEASWIAMALRIGSALDDILLDS